jgi:hypothetical protein
MKKQQTSTNSEKLYAKYEYYFDSAGEKLFVIRGIPVAKDAIPRSSGPIIT